jgi:predicted O-methyltransferase YrrM
LARLGPGSGQIVEIGSFLGNSTIFLARGAMSTSRERVHAIDPHTSSSMTQLAQRDGASRDFLKNLERFDAREYVEYHKTTSADAASGWAHGQIRFLYVDGMHTYDAVRADFEMWKPHLASEYVVVFDDFLWPDVERAVRDLRSEFNPDWFAVRGGQAMFASDPLPLRHAGLP